MFSHAFSDNSMWTLRKIFSNNQITFPLLELALEILIQNYNYLFTTSACVISNMSPLRSKKETNGNGVPSWKVNFEHVSMMAGFGLLYNLFTFPVPSCEGNPAKPGLSKKKKSATHILLIISVSFGRVLANLKDIRSFPCAVRMF